MNFNLVVIEGFVFSIERIDDTKVMFMVMANRSYGDNEQTTNKLEIIVERKLAEVCEKYLESGSHVLVTGCLKNKENASTEGFIIEGREVRFLPKTKKQEA